VEEDSCHTELDIPQDNEENFMVTVQSVPLNQAESGEQSIGNRQTTDSELKTIIDYQEEGILSSDDKKARGILLSRSQYHMIGKVLYYVETNKTFRLIPPESDHKKLLKKLIVEYLVLI